MAANAAKSATSNTAKKLGTSGKVFFGSLCVGTFGLGCWQLQRLLEKWDAIDDRQQQLGMSPIRYGNRGIENTLVHGNLSTYHPDRKDDQHPYRRRLLRGRLRHDKEVLIGPRGAPPGVQMPVQGLSAKQQQSRSNAKTTTVSGMQPGPQGFYVFTPMEVDHGDARTTSDATSVVWINRGWVPKTVVPGADRPHYKNDPLQRARLDGELLRFKREPAWNRPEGPVEVTVVLSKPEKPRFITPEHDYSKRPLQLFWIDGLALKAIAADMMTEKEQQQTETALVTQVVDDTEGDATSNSDSSNTQQLLVYPLQPPVSSVGNFKTTPAVHMGYAATWFGLSGAGWYMTRKLMTKGRW